MIGLCLEFFSEIMANVALILCKFFETENEHVYTR